MSPVPTPPNALDTFDRHWAVKVVTPEDRANAVSFAMGIMSRICAGEIPATSTEIPEYFVPLAGAYVIAAREWLDFEGAASPSALASSPKYAYVPKVSNILLQRRNSVVGTLSFEFPLQLNWSFI